MASLCKFCAKLNTGGKCIFCGNRLSAAPVRAAEAAEALPEEPVAVPQPYSAVQPVQKQKNPMAIAGFVLSVSLYFCVLGLILSIVGLVKSRSLNGEGKGLAIAGIAVSGIVILGLGIFYLLLFWGTWNGMHPGEWLF